MFTSKVGLPAVARPTRLGRVMGTRIPALASKCRILIVDGDRKASLALGFMLAARLYDDVRTVKSAQRALAISKQFHPEIVFLDLELPGDNGLEVARQLAEVARPLRPRLIALTNYPEHLGREAARLAGFERYLVKPISQEELDKVLGIVRAAA
jgi:CheY-like chemotaxis protein